MYNKAFLIALAIYLFITGLMLVTNIEIVWMSPVRGIAALVAGVIALVVLAVSMKPGATP